MIFEKKYFSRYILLTDQISLSDCQINLIVFVKFLCQDKNVNILRRSFQDEVKIIFHHL